MIRLIGSSSKVLVLPVGVILWTIIFFLPSIQRSTLKKPSRRSTVDSFLITQVPKQRIIKQGRAQSIVFMVPPEKSKTTTINKSYPNNNNNNNQRQYSLLTWNILAPGT